VVIKVISWNQLSDFFSEIPFNNLSSWWRWNVTERMI